MTVGKAHGYKGTEVFINKSEELEEDKSLLKPLFCFFIKTWVETLACNRVTFTFVESTTEVRSSQVSFTFNQLRTVDLVFPSIPA